MTKGAAFDFHVSFGGLYILSLLNDKQMSNKARVVCTSQLVCKLHGFANLYSQLWVVLISSPLGSYDL